MHQSKYLPYKEINEENRPKKIKKINQYFFIDKLGLALNQDKKDESTEKSKNQELYYAAKAIHIHEDAQKSKTLEREIILLRLLDHPYIIKLYNDGVRRYGISNDGVRRLWNPRRSDK